MAELITQLEKDKTIVQYMQAQQRDLHIHNVNLERYNTMLETLPEGKYKDRIVKLKAETEERIEEVSAIVAATEPQMPSQERIDAALLDIENS